MVCTTSYALYNLSMVSTTPLWSLQPHHSLYRVIKSLQLHWSPRHHHASSSAWFLQPPHGFYNLSMVPSVSLRSLLVCLDADTCRCTPCRCSWVLTCPVSLRCVPQVQPLHAHPYQHTHECYSHTQEREHLTGMSFFSAWFLLLLRTTNWYCMDGLDFPPCFQAAPESTFLCVSHPANHLWSCSFSCPG